MCREVLRCRVARPSIFCTATAQVPLVLEARVSPLPPPTWVTCPHHCKLHIEHMALWGTGCVKSTAPEAGR